MHDLKSTNLFTRLDARQFNGQRIAQKLRQSGYIAGLPQDFVSAGGLTKDDMTERLQKFENCGSIVEIEKYSDGTTRTQNANYCNLLGCWHCGSRQERKRYTRLIPKIEQANKTFPYAYHVVFTIKDGSDVRQQSKFLRDSLTTWRKYGQMRKGKADRGEYGKAEAALFSHEIVEGRFSKLWHTHTHAIIWTSKRLDFRVYDQEKKAELMIKYGGEIPKNILDSIALRHVENIGVKKSASKISAEWHRATRGQGQSIFVRLIDTKHAFNDAITEVIKYATKMNENRPDRVADIQAQCHGLRFFSTARKMRYNQSAGDLPPERPPEKEMESEIYAFKWDRQSNQYAEYEPLNPIIIHDRNEDRKECLSKAAKLIGQYRSARNRILAAPAPGIPLYIQLDDLKKEYRKIIRQCWKNYARMQYTAAQENQLDPAEGPSPTPSEPEDFTPHPPPPAEPIQIELPF